VYAFGYGMVINGSCNNGYMKRIGCGSYIETTNQNLNRVSWLDSSFIICSRWIFHNVFLWIQNILIKTLLKSCGSPQTWVWSTIWRTSTHKGNWESYAIRQETWLWQICFKKVTKT